MISSFMLFVIFALAGCTTTYLDMKRWHGRTINDLYFEWGKPDEVVSLNTGGRAHTWFFERKGDGKDKVCKKTFYTRNTGNDEVITKTSYKDCLFLIAR